MDGQVIHLFPRLAVAGALGILAAVIVLRPVLRRTVSRPGHLCDSGGRPRTDDRLGQDVVAMIESIRWSAIER
jgi:hypothetical protein